MARDLKDELQGEMPQTGVMDQFQKPSMIPKLPGSVQISVTQQMEETLVQLVKEDYQAAKDARDNRDYGKTDKGENLNFEKWYKQLKDLYNAQREPKDTPWKFCSNRSLRIATSIVDMLHARLFPAVLNEDLLRWKPGDITDVPKVERISKLMQWWLFVNSKVRSFFDNWVKSVIAFGDCMTETIWKVEYIDSGETINEPIIDEMGQPMTNPDGTPATLKYRDIRMRESTQSRIYLKDQVFLKKGSRDLNHEPVVLEDELLYRDLEEGESSGKFVNVSTLLKEHLAVAFERRAGLSPDEEERIRSIKLRNQPVKILIWYDSFDADSDGFPEEVKVIISPEHDIYLSGIAVKNISKTGRSPLDLTKFDSRIDRPEENDGEGVLEKIMELAKEIDAIFNQLTDANTISILRPGFYDPSGDIDAPSIKLAPNKITPVSAPNQNLFFPEFRIQTDQLINAIRLVLEFIERLTAASSYVLGKESEIVGGSGTATRTNAIVQSAEQRFALPAERLREGASRIIRQHLDLLQLNIPKGLESRILGEKGEPVFEANELTAEGIAGEFDAYLPYDPSMGSKQTERELASMFYSILLQNMIVGTDPVKIYKVTADLLKAYGKDPIEYLGPEPQSDLIDSPEDENTLIVQGDFVRVRAQITENHILHIKAHMDLLSSPTLAQLQIAPNLVQSVMEFTQQHVQEHQLMMTAMMQLMTKVSGAGQSQKGSNSENGKDNGNGSDKSQGSGGPSGLENVSGPLGNAMDQKRKGESGSTPPK